MRNCKLRSHAPTHLEALVLQDAFDGGIFSAGGQLGLEDYTERAVAHNLALCVCQVLVLAGLTILNLFADDFCVGVRNRAGAGCRQVLTAHSERGEGRWPVLAHCLVLCNERVIRQTLRGLLSRERRAVAKEGVGVGSRRDEEIRGGR
jgi:hypothetical protein